MIKAILNILKSKATKQTYFNSGTQRWVVHNNDQSDHRKYTLYYEDLCQ